MNNQQIKEAAIKFKNKQELLPAYIETMWNTINKRLFSRYSFQFCPEQLRVSFIDLFPYTICILTQQSPEKLKAYGVSKFNPHDTRMDYNIGKRRAINRAIKFYMYQLANQICFVDFCEEKREPDSIYCIDHAIPCAALNCDNRIPLNKKYCLKHF